MSPGDFHALNTFILKTTGMNVPGSNVSTVESFVSSCLETYGLTMEEYLKKLGSERGEMARFLGGITINETYFFREERQFFLLRDVLIPRWNSEGNDPLNIWSASCSSGEEPLSLLALLGKYCSRPFRIVASDLSPAAMAGFAKGEFRKSSFRTDGRELTGLMEPLIESRSENTLSIGEWALEKVDRKIINVFHDKLDDLPCMDLIFFRNTMIYMSPANREAIATRLVKRLKPGGVIFFSVSETALISHPLLKIEEAKDVFFFRKQDYPVSLKKDRFVGPVAPPVAFPDDVSMCRRISRIAADGNLSPAAAENAAVLYGELVGMLDNQSLGEAAVFLNENREMKKYRGLFAFFSGYIAYSLSRSFEAFTSFRTALEIAPSLWPARFYLLRSAGNRLTPEERKGELERILLDIGEYIRAGRFDFQILLEGFNARYFEMICHRELEEIATGSGKYAYQ